MSTPDHPLPHLRFEIIEAARTPARGYGPLIRSERRSRMHPVLLQKIYEGAHLRQEQAVAQG
jgi:hypothetical protein